MTPSKLTRKTYWKKGRENSRNIKKICFLKIQYKMMEGAACEGEPREQLERKLSNDEVLTSKIILNMHLH